MYAMPLHVRAELIRLEQRALAVLAVYALGATWAHHYAHAATNFVPVPE